MTTSHRATLVVPIRSFEGKTRLAGSIPEERRRELTRTLADRVVTAGLGSGMNVIVVTGNREVREWTNDRNVEVVDDPGTGLNDAALAGIDAVDGRWIVAHADLPFVTASALARLLDETEDRVTLAPSLDGGTNAISGTGTVDFRFGVGSFHRHLAVYPRATVVVVPGLAIDIDTPDNLRAIGAIDPSLASTSHG